jgi:hypothetical protein
VKTFKQFVKEDWKRAALMGAAATAAGAGTAAAIGFPVAAGAAIAGGHYLFSKSGLRQDLKTRIKRKRLSEGNVVRPEFGKKPSEKKDKPAEVSHLNLLEPGKEEFFKKLLSRRLTPQARLKINRAKKDD